MGPSDEDVDYGYDDADYGYGDTEPDYGYAAPDDEQDDVYGDSAPAAETTKARAEEIIASKHRPKRRCSVTKYNLDNNEALTAADRIHEMRNEASVSSSTRTTTTVHTTSCSSSSSSSSSSSDESSSEEDSSDDNNNNNNNNSNNNSSSNTSVKKGLMRRFRK